MFVIPLDDELTDLQQRILALDDGTRVLAEIGRELGITAEEVQIQRWAAHVKQGVKRMSDTDIAVYARLNAAAEAGLPCPTSVEMVERGGAEKRVDYAIRRLQALGLIRKSSATRTRRVITIVATGKSTQPTSIECFMQPINDVASLRASGDINWPDYSGQELRFKERW